MSDIDLEVKQQDTQQDQRAIFDKIVEASDNGANQFALPVLMLTDHVEVEVHTGVKKKISYADFKDIINRALNQVESAPIIAGTLLPSNTIFFSQTNNSIFINVYHPGCIREMLYHRDGGKKRKVVTPNIVMGFEMRKDGEDLIVAKALYFCTDLPVSRLPRNWIGGASHSQGIYELPMSNTYGGGTMCYGSNSMPARFKDNNLRGLDWYFRFLWETPFNDDLGVRAVARLDTVQGWYNELQKIADEGGNFPYTRLAGYAPVSGAVSL